MVSVRDDCEQVQDLEPQYLPGALRDRHGKPQVRLIGDKYDRLIERRRVRGGEDFSVCTGETLRTA